METLPKKINEKAKDVLDQDERFIDYISEPWSYYKGKRWTILTNKRIILIKNRFFTYDMFTLIKLINVNLDIKEGILFDSIFVSYFDHKFNLQFYSRQREKTLSFFHNVNQQIEDATSGRDQKDKKRKEEDFHEKLNSLARVFNERIIDEKEYEARKKKILDNM